MTMLEICLGFKKEEFFKATESEKAEVSVKF